MADERYWSRIVLPAGDGLLQILGMAAENGIRIFRPGQTVEALAIRGSVAYPASRILHLKHVISLRFLEKAPVSVRHHLDPVFIDWVDVQPPPRTGWQLMPDPVDVTPPLDRRTARTLLRIPVDGVVVGCVGVLDERKGVDLLANAFGSARLPGNAHLLLVGTCTAGVKAAVDRLRARPRFAGRVHLVDEWVTDETIMTAIAAMDLVVTAYPGHVGSASIVLRVMAAGRPVLGAPTPWIARHVLQYKAGWVSDVGNPEAFAADLARAAENALSWQPSPHVRELLAFNSPENFMAHWTQSTAAELGCSPVFPFLPPPGIPSAHPE
jgi:glycosyltransferase involved in cell wall biosynthesis